MAGEQFLEGAELLIDSPMARRGKNIMAALADTAPKGSEVSTGYTGRHKLLVVYGIGLEQRLAARDAHLKRGGRVAMWDLGYWDREEAMRLSIDTLHPSAADLQRSNEPSRRRFYLRADANERGPILLAGLGRKSARMFGFESTQWEDEKRRDLAARFPGRAIRVRQKGDKSAGPIENALRGCSLVVCRHSNVAVDACIAGIPVECEDGAARALYANDSNPSTEAREDFLRRLSWWNWRPCEAPQAWEWLQRMTA